jgi:hypothetical protein
MLAAWLVANAEIGHPVLKPVLLILAFTIAKDLGAKIKPGSCMKGWFRRFLERNNELHCEDNGIDIPKLKLQKKPEQLSHQQARSMTPETVLGCQNRCIGPVLENHPNLTLAHVGGWDEWMLEVNKAIHGGRVVTPPGTLYTKVPAERDEHMTCLSGYVVGWATPVLLVFKGIYLNPQWMEFVPDDGMVIVGVSENGWITEELKLQWFLHIMRHPPTSLSLMKRSFGSLMATTPISITSLVWPCTHARAKQITPALVAMSSKSVIVVRQSFSTQIAQSDPTRALPFL